MKKKKADSFTCFLAALCALIFFLLIRLFLGMQEEKRTYTTLVSLGDFTYDNDFLKSASKIKGLQAIYPVVEIPVTLKIEDYTETTAFYGIDLSAFVQNPDEDSLGTVPLLLLCKNSLSNMKDSNGHQISQKQQQKYLQMGEELSITYSMDADTASDVSASAISHTISSSTSTSAASTTANASGSNPSVFAASSTAATTWLPCRTAAVLENQDTEIYIPLSQAQALCQSSGMNQSITSVLLKINGKENLENARQLFQ